MTTVLVALLTGAVFSTTSILALYGSRITQRSRAYAAAAAAGILLALAFGDLFPESLQLGADTAVVGFTSGFALLFLIETFTRAHTHHLPGEEMHHHSVNSFVIGLTVHNIADGFAIGISSQMGGASSWLLALGIALHQLPVGFSLAAVFAAAHADRKQTIRAATFLGLVIPVAAAVTIALPGVIGQYNGLFLGISGGLLTYVAATHLLPEAQAEHPSKTTGIVFVLSLFVMVAAYTMFE